MLPPGSVTENSHLNSVKAEDAVMACVPFLGALI